MGAVEEFSLSVSPNGQETVVRLVGDLDIASAPALRQCLMTAGDPLVVDFSAVTFMDSTAIGVLIAAQNRRNEQGTEIVLRNVAPMQMRVFEITGVDVAFTFDG